MSGDLGLDGRYVGSMLFGVFYSLSLRNVAVTLAGCLFGSELGPANHMLLASLLGEA